MKILGNVNFKSFSSEYTNRFDYNYISYFYNDSKKTCNKIPFSEIADIIEPQSIDIDSLDEFKYCQIGDVDGDGLTYPVIIDLNNQKQELNDYYVKIQKGDIIKPQIGDILISKIRPYLKEIIYIDDSNSDIYFTKAFIILRPKIDSRLLYAYIRCNLYYDFNSISRTGKGYPTLNPKDFDSIIIDNNSLIKLINNNKDDIITNRIKEIDKIIKNLIERKSDVTDIINEEFDRYFNFDVQTFNQLNNNKIYFSKLTDFSNNVDCRFSSKFHRPAGKFVEKEIEEREHYILKDIIEIPIITGQGISNEWDDEGNYSYISMADISKWELNLESLKNVTEKYAESHLTKRISGSKEEVSTTVEIGDILMMRSGEGGIGKVALVENNIKAIFCDFIIRFRFKKSLINPKYMYYYFRTRYFQYLIEIYKKGLGNNTNIFPNILQEFKAPKISLDEQERLVAKISNRIEQQRKNILEIESQMAKIDSIINDNLK